MRKLILKSKDMKYVVAGGVARASANILMCPFDTVKTRMQYQNKGMTSTFYSSSRNCFSSILKKEGFFALYSGLSFKLMYSLPAACISFVMYENTKRYLTKVYKIQDRKKRTLSYLKVLPVPFIAGASARILATLVRTPFDLLKQRMQINGMQTVFPNRSWIEMVRMCYNRKDFFRGYGITLMRDAPFAALYFTMYELSKRLMKGKDRAENQDKSVLSKNVKFITHDDLIHLLSGSIASTIATTFTIPIDTLKTRVQTDPETYTGIRTAFRLTLEEGGPRAFMKGLGPRLMYLIPAASLTFMFYEKMKLIFASWAFKKLNQ